MQKSFYLFSFFLLFSFISNAQNIVSKKEKRIQDRFIHPKSKYVAFAGGFGFTSTFTKDPNSFLQTGPNMRNNHYFPHLSYEHGIGQQIFLESGYEFGKIAISMGRTFADEQTWSSTTRIFNNHNLNTFQLGAGYRIIGKNNIHFLNVHGGLFFGVSNKKPSELQFLFSGTANFTITEEVPFSQYEIYRSIQSYSRFTFGPYLGISKEFRLSQQIRLFVKYTQRFGLKSIFEGTYSSFSDNLNLPNDAKFKVTGGGGFLSFGLKVLLFKN